MTHLKCLVIFFVYIHRCVQLSPQLILEYFHHLRRKTLTFSCYSPAPHQVLQLLATTNPLPVSTDLPILNISYINGNHTICGVFVFYLAYCFWVSSMLHMNQYFIPFYVWILSHCMDRTHFVYITSWWTFVLFLLFGYYKLCCCKHLCTSFCMAHYFISLGWIRQDGIGGSYGNFVV